MCYLANKADTYGKTPELAKRGPPIEEKPPNNQFFKTYSSLSQRRPYATSISYRIKNISFVEKRSEGNQTFHACYYNVSVDTSFAKHIQEPRTAASKAIKRTNYARRQQKESGKSDEYVDQYQHQH
jgi:hypothetical protein